MKSKSWWCIAALSACLPAAGWAGTFGKVVAIGGHASDLALDEPRGVMYVANFTANRIEVVSLGDGSIQTSINVPPQPGSLALSPDGRYLVVAHFGNFQAPDTPRNALSVIDLRSNAKQTFALGYAPLGVAFGISNQALIATTNDFSLFDPVTGVTTVLDTVAGLTAKTLPAPPANAPPQIITASMNVSGDGAKVYGLTDTIEFSYDFSTRRLSSFTYFSAPPMGPRVVSVDRDGSRYLAGWAMSDARGHLLAQFPNPSGALEIGSHLFDSARGLIYAQMPTMKATSTTPASPLTPTTPTDPTQPTDPTKPTTPTTSDDEPLIPILQICDIENLAVYERLLLPESLAGKSVMSSDGRMMYAISESGLLMLPVGALHQAPRVQAVEEDIVFRNNSCDRRALSQQMTMVDPGGGSTDFSLSTKTAGIRLSPTSGTTPATVRVTVDPSYFQNQKGTIVAEIEIKTNAGVNIPAPVRVLVNLKDPDQRGTVVNVPGKLVDILADPVRDRFYILRQDRNQVLVYDGTNYSLLKTLKTGNTPTQMAISFDRRRLMIGADNSQIAHVYDLETLEPSTPIYMPFGSYPRSIASSGGATLIASRVAGPKHHISRVDWGLSTATTYPSLGVFENSVNADTVLVASPNGGMILAAGADGVLTLYDANQDTFVISRKDSTKPTGAYAASSFEQFVVGNNLLNKSLVVMKQLETGTGTSSGFAFVDNAGLRTTTPGSAMPGVIQRVDVSSGTGQRATRMAESPLTGDKSFAFSRTLAPLYSRNAIVNLTTSGFTVLAWSYDAAVAPPRLERVVSFADQTSTLAPGGLVSVYGQNLSPVNIATKELPLPTALGESCLVVNGTALPVLFVSPTQINAQLPYLMTGNVTMILRTPGGVSDNFNLKLMPAAPGVIRNGVAGPQTDVPLIMRAANDSLVTPSNPVHRGDTLSIYLTGMGNTSPPVEAGVPGPSDPAAEPLIPAVVDIGGFELPITLQGLAPGQVGIYQINVKVPVWGVPTGMSQPLTINQGGFTTTVPVRVVD